MARLGVPTGEPHTRGYMVPPFKRALVERFGEEGRQRALALLQGDAREALASPVSVGAWFPTRHMIVWGFAVYDGPCGGDRELMAAFVRHQWDLGVGVVRRMMLHMAPPTAIVPRLAKLWEEDNSAGELHAEMQGSHAAVLRISNTPWVDSPQTRLSMAEVYRHAFANTRAREVTASHTFEAPRTMTIRLRWK